MMIACAGCGKDDDLYDDTHGKFCGRCGPDVPVRGTIKWYTGMSWDKEGNRTDWVQDGKGGLKPCPNSQ